MVWVERPVILQCFLDMFGALTGGVPLEFFIGTGDSYEGFRSSPEIANRDYCAAVGQIPRFAKLCRKEHERRAYADNEDIETEVVTCHAGLQNCVIRTKGPVGEHVAVVVGEYRSTNEQRASRSLANHSQLLSRCQGVENQLVKALTEGFERVGRIRSLDDETVSEYAGVCRVVAPTLCQTLLREDATLREAVEDTSHELQTRIQAILSDTESILLAPDWTSWKELKPNLERVLSTTIAAATVVHSLEDYLGETPTSRVPIQALVENAVSYYEAEARRKGIVVRLDMADPVLGQEHPPVMVRHMQYAINNLLQNAIKYSYSTVQRRSSRGTHPRVVLVRGVFKGRFYELSFQNYGVGITPAEIEQEKIFEAQHHGDLTHGEFRQGAGRGLNLVKRVITAHGGTITVTSKQMSDSQEAKGEPHLTTFVVKLPCQRGGR